jgi:hypothetical protein
MARLLSDQSVKRGLNLHPFSQLRQASLSPKAPRFRVDLGLEAKLPNAHANVLELPFSIENFFSDIHVGNIGGFF